MGGIDLMDWLPEEMKWSGFWDEPSGLSEEHLGVHNYDDRQFSQPLLRSLRYDSRQLTSNAGSRNVVMMAISSAQSKLDVVEWFRHVLNIQTEEDREKFPP
jgi:hypothetical protein